MSKNCIHFINRFSVSELWIGNLYDCVDGTYNGPDIKNKKKILYQVTRGLAHLHALGVVHGDIKPSNILIFSQVDANNIQTVIKLAGFEMSGLEQNTKIRDLQT